MKVKMQIGLVLSIIIIALMLCCTIDFNAYAYTFPQINFNFAGKTYSWNLSMCSQNHNTIFSLQQKYLNIKNSGIKNEIKRLKKLKMTEQEIMFNILPAFEDLYKIMRNDIESEFIETQIDFNPSAKQMFNFKNGRTGVKIDDVKLLNDIASGKENIEIKTLLTNPRFEASELYENTERRSVQSTSFAGSESGRRFNLQKAMATFNGLVVMPNEIVSFANVLNTRDNGEAYRDAVVIVNGEFTRGVGGGICQASTTIYNAVLMAGLEILEVHRHTLPVGYVEKGFDAMVNDSGIDMRFKNNLNYPIYIKTYSANENVYAEVYGSPMNGIWYKKVSEKIKDIEPDEPEIIPDTEGKYIDKIKYKGEMYTEKYAKKGYEVKGYLYTYKGNELINKKLIRHEKYASTRAKIYEGVQEKESEND